MSSCVEFSFVVPVWNTDPEFFQACVQSIVRAAVEYDLGRVELVVVDDGSRPEISAKYQMIYRSVAVGIIRSVFVRWADNRGIAAARDAGIRRVVGKWVILVDSDDLVSADVLNVLAEHITEDTVLAFTAHEKRDVHLAETVETRRKARYARLLVDHAGGPHDPFLHFTFLIHMHVIRLSAYRAVGGFDVSIPYGDEIDFHLRLTGAYQKPGSYTYIDEVLYFYRENPDGVCGDPEKYRELIETIEKILLRHAVDRGVNATSCQRSGKVSDGAVAYCYK
ncbi:glycosyltransferase family 2 protein [Streptomyces sp. NPDC127038]|uniref:glycosyltransferase family 2 protein n=1 Tax=Streptomyces sp. NPDC127038 TaxID=3347114 RepID=UPI003662D3BE